MRKPLTALAGDRRGTAAVEFAILVPVLLLLLTGMIAYSLYFGAFHALQQLAADAARTAIAGLSEAERIRMVTNYIQKNGGDYMLVEAEHLRFEVSDKPSDLSEYQVRLIYNADTLPIWNLYPPLPLPSKELVVVSTIRKGGI